jgi:hypothetical protein
VRAAWFALLLWLGGCSVEKMPPVALVRVGQQTPPRRVALLPSECASAVCKGLNALVLAELAFRGYQVVDLEKLPAVNRSRSELVFSEERSRDGAPRTRDEHRVRVEGPMLSDLDVWTLREELARLGVDALVRVRSARVPDRPPRRVTVVRMTRAADASLVSATLCEAEVSSLDSEAEGAEQTLRCALKALP